MVDTVCFFELPVDDFDSAQSFYGELFEWTFEKIPGPFRYYKINTGSDAIKGGMTARQDPQHSPLNYVRVESVLESLEKAEKLGAKVIVSRRAVPGRAGLQLCWIPMAIGLVCGRKTARLRNVSFQITLLSRMRR